VEWRIKLEATSGWGEVETIEVAHFTWRVVGLTAEEIASRRQSRFWPICSPHFAGHGADYAFAYTTISLWEGARA
jgi:hypothetical protein